MSEAAVLRYEPLANRRSTFAVRVGDPSAGSVLIGYLRLDDQVRWVARTLGSASEAADIRRFRSVMQPRFGCNRRRMAFTLDLGGERHEDQDPPAIARDYGRAAGRRSLATAVRNATHVACR
jgi:hypothetical protein